MATEEDYKASVSLNPGWWNFVTECLQEKIEYIDNLKQGEVNDDAYADFKNDVPIYRIILNEIQNSASAKMQEIEQKFNAIKKVR